MIRHKVFRSKVLNISKETHPDGKIQIDENGFVSTELSDEAKQKLLGVDGFTEDEPVAPPPDIIKDIIDDEDEPVAPPSHITKDIIDDEDELAPPKIL